MPMEPWCRNALTAIEWTLLVPLIPALLYKKKLHKMLCIVQLTAFVWLTSSVLLPGSFSAVPWWAFLIVLLTCWAFHMFMFQTNPPPEGRRLIAIRLLGYASGFNFVTCFPMHYKHSEHRSVLRMCRFVVHCGVAVAAVLLGVYYIVYVPTYEAWGCYPPGVPLSGHNLGMCGTRSGHTGSGWWAKRTTKESEVCIVYEAYGDQTCTPPIPASRAYGSAITYGHNALLSAVAAYILGAAFAWESALDGGSA